MSRVASIIVYYTDGTFEEIKSPSRSYKYGEVTNGSTVARVETKFEDTQSSPDTKILLTEG